MRPEEAVQATLSSLPDEVVESVGVTALPSEDALSERVRKLEYLQKQEELIKVLFLPIFNLLDNFSYLNQNLGTSQLR